MEREGSRVEEKDRHIVECLLRDPEASLTVLAETTGYPASTIQKRLQRMTQKNHLRRGIQVNDWSALGFRIKSRIDVKVNASVLARGEGGPPDDHRKSEDRKEPLPPLPPQPTETMYTQAELARYIKNVIPKQYTRRLVVESVSLLVGGKADISIVVRAIDEETVWAFTLNSIRVLGSVNETTTSREVGSY